MPKLWTVPILTYHRIGEPKGDHVPTVTPESFVKQLSWIARFRFAVVSLSEAIEQLGRPEPNGRRRVIITFDDGYEETASVAAPLLHRFGFRATVFITPNEIGLSGFMTWDQVRSLVGNGFSVGSHTLYHTYLPLASLDQVREELLESKRILEHHVGQPVLYLSYPVGGFTPAIQSLVRAAGYLAACTTNRGLSKTAQDLFALRRIKITERDRHPLLLWAKLSGYYDLFRRLEQPA